MEKGITLRGILHFYIPLNLHFYFTLYRLAASMAHSFFLDVFCLFMSPSFRTVQPSYLIYMIILIDNMYIYGSLLSA